MDFWGDDRGQAIQIGAILLFGVLIIAFAGYQAFVVPNQNEQVEFSHNQDVQQDLQDVRNAIMSGVGGGSARSVTVDLGTRYPTRAIALNPGPATGTLRTIGTTNPMVNVTIKNATANGETGDFWNGNSRNYSTGALVYEPNYNRYREAPTTIYDTTVLSNQFRDGNRTITGQRLLEGDTITLVTLNGSVSASTSESYSLDIRPVSSSARTVQVRSDDDEPTTITVPTRLSNRTWSQLLRDESATWEYDADAGPGEFGALTIKLDPGWYTLRMAKIGVGTEVRDEDKAYVTTVDGDDASIQPDETQTLVAEVRDAYNNPVAGKLVNATADQGTLPLNNDVSDIDGRVEFQYTAPSTEGEYEVTVDVADSPESAEEATFDITVTAGGSSEGTGAYSVSWLDPSGNANVDCGTDLCTVDASDDRTVKLTMDTSPTAVGAGVEYAVSNATVGAVTPTQGITDVNGQDTTTLEAREEGTTYVYTSSGSDGDRLEFEIIDLNFERVAYVDSNTGDLNVLSSDGRITTYQSTEQIRAIGSMGDYDGDGLEEIPYVNNDRELKLVDSGGGTQTIVGSVTYGDATIAAGDGDGDGTTEYYYTDENTDTLREVEEGGMPTSLEVPPGQSGNCGNASPVETDYGAADVADVDGDGENEIVFASENDKVAYFDGPSDCGSVVEISNTDVGSGNGGVGIGSVAEIGGDQVVPFVNSDQDLAYVDADENEEILTSSYEGASPSPVAVRDWDGDGDPEIVHINGGEGRQLYHAGIADSALEPITYTNGDPVIADRDSGAR